MKINLNSDKILNILVHLECNTGNSWTKLS